MSKLSEISNFNNRDCYERKLPLHPNMYRRQWITAFERDAVNYPNIYASFTEQEKKKNWEKLKYPGVYNIPVFGDYVLDAIAKGCKKNILIFNTSVDATDPIYVIEANRFGGSADSDIPVVLAYNQFHYESLHPTSLEDIEKTKQLVINYTQGNYTYSKKDIGSLTSCSKKSEDELIYKENSATTDKKTLISMMIGFKIQKKESA